MGVIRRLVAAAPAACCGPGGSLLMEIGEEQAGAARLADGGGGLRGIGRRRDLSGVERYIGGQCAGRPAPAVVRGGRLMADALVIEGGGPLRGEVAVSAAKNAALPALAAALLTAEPVVLDNVPALADVRTIRALLERLGRRDHDEPRRRHAGARARASTSHEAPYELVSTMRASVLVLGPLLARDRASRASRCPAAAPSACGPSTST